MDFRDFLSNADKVTMDGVVSTDELTERDLDLERTYQGRISPLTFISTCESCNVCATFQCFDSFE